MDLFKPSGLAKLAFGRATASVQEQVSAAVGNVTTSSEKKIEWTSYNWPMKHEYLGLLHFDLAELREKRSETMYMLVLLMYRWWQCMLGMFGLNFVTTIVLMATMPSAAFSSLSILYWLIEFGSYSSLGMFAVYKAYHGWTESSGRSKTFARGTAALLAILLVIPIFVFGGNVNGLSGYGSSAFSIASQNGAADGAVAFWKAMIAIESLIWMGLEGWLGFCLFKLMTE